MCEGVGWGGVVVVVGGGRAEGALQIPMMHKTSARCRASIGA